MWKGINNKQGGGVMNMKEMMGLGEEKKKSPFGSPNSKGGFR